MRKWRWKQIGTDIEGSFQYFVAKTGVEGLWIPPGCTMVLLRQRNHESFTLRRGPNPKEYTESNLPQSARESRWGGGAWRLGASHYWLC